jgi:hypothetical protein
VFHGAIAPVEVLQNGEITLDKDSLAQLVSETTPTKSSQAADFGDDLQCVSSKMLFDTPKDATMPKKSSKTQKQLNDPTTRTSIKNSKTDEKFKISTASAKKNAISNKQKENSISQQLPWDLKMRSTLSKEEKSTDHISSRKPYSCDVCEKRFWKKHNLLKHSSHCGMKPYSCELCERRFSHKHHVKRHKMKSRCQLKLSEEKQTLSLEKHAFCNLDQFLLVQPFCIPAALNNGGVPN